MSFRPRIAATLVLLSCLLCQACSHLPSLASASQPAVAAHRFQFDDGGAATYFVLDKQGKDAQSTASGNASRFPDTYFFVIAGSDCMSMRQVLPDYFKGLDGVLASIRIFILQKRFIEQTAGRDAACSAAFTEADHPSRWIADQREFIHAELAAAKVNGQTPQHVVIVGISEGAEIAPILARDIPATHAVLIGNGGMDPLQAYRLQAEKYGFSHGLQDIEHVCFSTRSPDNAVAAERPCRYWKELRDIRHTDNLLGLDLPLFIAMGEADSAVPIESAWFIRDQFAARGKTNLQLQTFPDSGHDFRRGRLSLLPYLWDALERWLQQ